MTLYVAPARYVHPAVHIATDDGHRTLCGKPMDNDDELWRPVDFTEPACRGCAHIAAKLEGRP
jgi:hypothetical protein